MDTIFATQSGFVRNTAVVGLTPPPPAPVLVHKSEAGQGSGLGGQIGALTQALNAVGWNHHQVPPEERSTAPSAPGHASGLGGQIGALTQALNAVGWNHNQVPPEERIPPQERE